MKLLPILITTLIATAPHSLAADDDPQVLAPLKPQILLRALPQAPEGWKLVGSAGEIVADQSIESLAERSYRLPAENPGGETPFVKFSILDTAKRGDILKRFSNFQAGPVREGIEAILIDEMPTFQSEGEGFVKFETLIDQRFIVTVLFMDANEPHLEDWLGKIRLSLLRDEAKQSGSVDLSRPVRIIEIDELNPSLNNVYLMTLSNEWSQRSARESLKDRGGFKRPPSSVDDED